MNETVKDTDSCCATDAAARPRTDVIHAAEGQAVVEHLAAGHGDECCGSGDACGPGDDCGHPQHGYLEHKAAHLRRLRRIEGQVRGLERMVDEEKYCIDILTQIAAVNSALKSVSLELLSEHMDHCVVRAARAGGQESEAKIAEANQAIARLVRS